MWNPTPHNPRPQQILPHTKITPLPISKSVFMVSSHPLMFIVVEDQQPTSSLSIILQREYRLFLFSTLQLLSSFNSSLQSFAHPLPNSISHSTPLPNFFQTMLSRNNISISSLNLFLKKRSSINFVDPQYNALPFLSSHAIWSLMTHTPPPCMISTTCQLSRTSLPSLRASHHTSTSQRTYSSSHSSKF